MENNTKSSNPKGSISEKKNEKVLEKINNFIKEGKYYDAEQLYKTLYYRYKARKQFKEAEHLLLQGTERFLKEGLYGEGTELGLLLIEIYTLDSRDPNDENICETIKKLYSYFPLNSSQGNRLIEAALKWSEPDSPQNSQNSQNSQKNKTTLLFHLLYGKSLKEQNEFGKAQTHLIKSASPKEVVKLCNEWSKKIYAQEHDLLVARATFQFLCLGDLHSANLFFQEILSKNPSLPRTPLLNFIKFLLLTLQRDALPLFQMLRAKYKKSLERDSVFNEYLDNIGEIFYKVKPQSGTAFFGNLIKTMFEE